MSDAYCDAEKHNINRNQKGVKIEITLLYKDGVGLFSPADNAVMDLFEKICESKFVESITTNAMVVRRHFER